MKRDKIRPLILFVILAVLCSILLIRQITKEEAPKQVLTAPSFEAHFDYSKFDFLKNVNFAETKNQINTEVINVRHLTLNGDKRRCLYFPINRDSKEGIEVIYRDIKINEMSRLTFGIGIDPNDLFLKRGKIKFQISIIDKGDKKKIFEKTLHPNKRNIDGQWFDFNIDMSEFSGKKLDIVFTASLVGRSKADVGAFWAEPTLHDLPYNEDWPNIIFISIDTLRADHLGCYGYRKDISPNVDRLAKDGVRYKYCVSQAPFTLTSYGSMFTGLYPNRGIIYKTLKKECLTMAEILSALGYYTISYNGGSIMSKDFGMDQGFRIFKSYPYNSKIENDIIWEFTNAMYALKREKYKKEKFFMFIHTYEAHDWYNPPEMYKRKFLRRDGYFKSGNKFLLRGDIKGYTGGYGWGFHDDSNRYKQIPPEHKEFFIDIYDAEINYMDAWLGRLLDFLKEEGLYEDTLIILNSDHGEEFYEHGGWSHSHQLYGELINVPLIIKYPKNKEKGIEAERIARSVDILPTILHDILGLKIESFNFDGVPLSMPLGDSKTLSFQFKGNSLVKIAIFEDECKLIRNFRMNGGSEPERPAKELFLYKIDRGDTNRVNTMHKEKSGYLNTLVTEEFKFYQTKMKLGDSGDFLNDLSEGALEKLKDLGYVQ